MTLPRFAAALVVALLLQAAVFAWRYDDLLYLDRPVVVAASAPDTFARHASEALSRPRLTRRHLDTIADAAERFGASSYEVQALQRRLEMDPANSRVKLRLADALRRAGKLKEAEELYLGVLNAPGGEAR